MNIKEMTTAEVYNLIYADCDSTTKYVSMPEEIACQVIDCHHFDKTLSDWAWLTVQSILESEAS